VQRQKTRNIFLLNYIILNISKLNITHSFIFQCDIGFFYDEKGMLPYNTNGHVLHAAILGFHSFLREYNDKDMAAMLVS
jgi:hypothetical protein